MFIILVMNNCSLIEERINTMTRPKKQRKVKEPPKISGMKPIGIPGRLLEKIVMSIDEYEAIRLVDYEDKNHTEASEIMNVSRPTLSRLIEKARNKVAEALVGVKDLMIEGGQVAFSRLLYRCLSCGEVQSFEIDSSPISQCPECNSEEIVNLNKRCRPGGRGRKGRHGKGGRGRGRR